MDLTPGTTLGPYRIDSAIGAGGMGAVYKATDTRLDRTVAIKTIQGRFSERFEREAKTIASLNHPNICTLHDVGPDYLVMEYIEGRPLEGPLPLAEVIRLGSQIAEALDAAHRKGITHRDLKPGNIMVTKSGVKVIDFGLAKSDPIILGETGATLVKPITAEGTMLGTVHYMSPEQLHGQDVDTRSDIFALGCVLYEMLSGKRAFEGTSAASIMAAILEKEPPLLSKVQPLAPVWFDRIIRRCLRKNPDERWQSAKDVAIELREPHEEPGTAPHQITRRAWLPWAVATLSALAAFGLLLRHPTTPQLQTYEFEINPPEGTRFPEGAQGNHAISPDGQTIALVVEATDGSRKLYLRQLASANYQALPGTEGAWFPCWSPDNKWIAYRTGSKIMKVAKTGGPPQSIGISGSSTFPMSWGADGTILFTREGRLRRISAAGGPDSPGLEIDTKRNESSQSSAIFLPDGKRFLFQSATPDGFTTALGSLYGGSSKPLMPIVDAVYSPSTDKRGHLLYVTDGQLYARPFNSDSGEFAGDAVAITSGLPAGPALSVALNGTLVVRKTALSAQRQFQWMDRTGSLISRIGSPEPIRNVTMSRDQSKAAYSHVNADWDVWVMDLERGLSSRLTSSADRTMYPVWSPDGKQIAFMRDKPGDRALVRFATDGSGTETVIAKFTTGYCTARQWTRDGKGIICSALRIAYSPVTGGAQQIPLSSSDFEETHGQVSPDGRWLSYTSNETGREEVHLRSMPPSLGGPATPLKLRVSKEGGSAARWRDDGKEMFFISSGRQLMAVPMNESAGQISPGEPKALFRVRSVLRTGFTYEPAANGKKFLFNDPVVELAPVPITVIVNWQGLLDKAK